MTCLRLFQTAPPISLTLTGNTVQELALNGSPVGTFSAVDPDNNTLAYKLLTSTGVWAESDGRFTVSGNKLLVGNGVKFDFEQATTQQVTVQVSDGNGRYGHTDLHGQRERSGR
jgi:hypothetical protein